MIDWMILSFFLLGIVLMANQSKLNVMEIDPDDRERESKISEAEAMLAELRNRSSLFQTKMANREKKEAVECNLD